MRSSKHPHVSHSKVHGKSSDGVWRWFVITQYDTYTADSFYGTLPATRMRNQTCLYQTHSTLGFRNQQRKHVTVPPVPMCKQIDTLSDFFLSSNPRSEWNQEKRMPKHAQNFETQEFSFGSRIKAHDVAKNNIEKKHTGKQSMASSSVALDRLDNCKTCCKRLSFQALAQGSMTFPANFLLQCEVVWPDWTPSHHHAPHHLSIARTALNPAVSATSPSKTCLRSRAGHSALRKSPPNVAGVTRQQSIDHLDCEKSPHPCRSSAGFIRVRRND